MISEYDSHTKYAHEAINDYSGIRSGGQGESGLPETKLNHI